MEEIFADRFEEYAEYFAEAQPKMVFASVIEGNTAAQLWCAPQSDDDVVCILWDKGNNVFYLSGQLKSAESVVDFASLINTEIKDRAIKEGLIYFKVKPLSPSLENSVTDIFQNIPLYTINKAFYAYRNPEVKAIPAPELEGVEYLLIDTDFLEKGQFGNHKYVKSEVEWMWPSPERFRERGFGIAAVQEENIICWCTAEYVSNNQCGIGIETVEKYRNKGIATTTAAHFLDHCLKQKITPHWECDLKNTGSVRVAEKVGFEKIEETVFWGGQFLT